jgi:hypothetical protein
MEVRALIGDGTHLLDRGWSRGVKQVSPSALLAHSQSGH